MTEPGRSGGRTWTTAESVVREVRSLTGNSCASCSHSVCGHEVVMSLVMGFADSPRCGPCLAGGAGLPLSQFLVRMLVSVRRKACLAAGWIEADQDERTRSFECVRIAGRVSTPVVMPEVEDEDAAVAREASEEGEAPPADAHYDAADLACGDLVLLLRKKLSAMSPGEVLELRATDPSASQDLPAWCRLTRHQLIRRRPPLYWIRRRSDDPDRNEIHPNQKEH